MNIIEINLTFKGKLTKRKTTNKIVIHHSDSDFGNAKTVHSWHLGNGWSGIGYHYIICQDGRIERGRPEEMMGAHTYQDKNHEANSDGIGVCLIGDFMKYKPNEEQYNSLIWLIKDIESRYGKLQILQHKDIMSTSCAGVYFDIDYLKKILSDNVVSDGDWKLEIMQEAKNKGLITGEHNPDDKADKWFVLKVIINALEVK